MYVRGVCDTCLHSGSWPLSVFFAKNLEAATVCPTHVLFAAAAALLRGSTQVESRKHDLSVPMMPNCAWTQLTTDQGTDMT